MAHHADAGSGSLPTPATGLPVKAVTPAVSRAGTVPGSSMRIVLPLRPQGEDGRREYAVTQFESVPARVENDTAREALLHRLG